MTPTRINIVLILSLLCTGRAFSQKTPVPGVRIWEPEVKHWISYAIIGPMNHPFPHVYITTRAIKIPEPEFLSVLPPHAYKIVSALVQAQITRPECPGTLPADWRQYEVEIFYHNPKGTRTCILPIVLGRNNLKAVVGLPGIDWSEKELRPINYFMDEVTSIIRGTSTDGKQGP